MTDNLTYSQRYSEEVPTIGNRVDDPSRYSGMVIAQYANWSWVLIDGAQDPTTYSTNELRKLKTSYNPFSVNVTGFKSIQNADTNHGRCESDCKPLENSTVIPAQNNNKSWLRKLDELWDKVYRINSRK